MSLRKSFKRARKKLIGKAGIIGVAKNLTGIGLLQRSKTARQVALGALAIGGAVVAAPYIASAAGAGKAALFSSGKNLLGRMYSPVKNPQNYGAADRTDLSTETQLDRMYGAETENIGSAGGVSARNAGAFGASGAVPVSCGAYGGDEYSFYGALFVGLAFATVVFVKNQWSTRHRYSA